MIVWDTESVWLGSSWFWKIISKVAFLCNRPCTDFAIAQGYAIAVVILLCCRFSYSLCNFPFSFHTVEHLCYSCFLFQIFTDCVSLFYLFPFPLCILKLYSCIEYALSACLIVEQSNEQCCLGFLVVFSCPFNLESDRQRRLGEWTNDDNDTGWLYTGLLARDRGKCHYCSVNC